MRECGAAAGASACGAIMGTAIAARGSLLQGALLSNQLDVDWCQARIYNNSLVLISQAQTCLHSVAYILQCKHRATLVLLLGGDKSTQRRDIDRARNYWADYLDRDDD